MSTHGNKDFLPLTDTYYILDTVIGQEGTGDDLSVLVDPGDSIVLNGSEYVVATVVGATGLTLTAEHGSTGPITGATGYIQQKPKVLSLSERATVYGVDATEMGATGIGAAHAGWVDVQTGSGPVLSVAIAVAGATGYDPDNPPPVVFNTGGASGIATISTSGELTGVTVVDGGLYSTTAPTATVGATGATGVQATTVTMGGRFGRKLYETLTVLSDNSKATMGDAEDTEFDV